MALYNELTFLLIVVISVLTGVIFEPPPALTKKQLLRTIHANASDEISKSESVIAVGTNICIDLVVNAEEFFAANKHFPTHNTIDTPESSKISSEQDLVDMYGYFFQRGAAAERFVKPEFFAQLIKTATTLSSTEKRIGGNAALMGNNLAKRGHTVLMSGRDSDAFRSLVNERVTFSEPSDTHEVEMHIILEYGSGDSFQGLTSDRANRLILSPFVVPSITALQSWANSVESFEPSPSALIFSGLHLFENDSPHEWTPYIDAANVVLSRTTNSIPQHLELASLSNEDLTKDIVKGLFPAVSSVGFNEQELGALFYALGGSYDDLPTKQCNPQRDAEAKRHRILRWKIVKRLMGLLDLESMLPEVDPPDIPPCLVGDAPKVAAISAALEYVFKAAHAQGATVSRFHFHSLGYHIIASAKSSYNLRQWSDATTSAAAGSITATYQACNVSSHEELHGDDLKLIVSTHVDVDGLGTDVRELQQDTALQVWDTDSLTITFVPVLVCKTPLVTVGLGDAISSSAFGAHL